MENQTNNKFCKFCGKEIASEAVICIHCGRQVEEVKKTDAQAPNIVINNTNTNSNVNQNNNGGRYGRPKNKWVAFLLCLLIGCFGAHKFYEGRIGAGILYLLTGGIFCIGWFIDTIILLCKPNPYYV